MQIGSANQSMGKKNQSAQISYGEISYDASHPIHDLDAAHTVEVMSMPQHGYQSTYIIPHCNLSTLQRTGSVIMALPTQ